VTSAFDEYDALADLAAHPGAAQDAVAPLAASVSGDLKRRGGWGDRSESESTDEGTPRRAGRWPLVIIGLAAWLTVLLAVTLVVHWLMGVAFLAVSVPAVFLERHRRREERARRERLTRPLCPACAYDLTGLEDALPRAWVVGRSGPRRCPECGEVWPLVPR
jgi:hypothetical protein